MSKWHSFWIIKKITNTVNGLIENVDFKYLNIKRKQTISQKNDNQMGVQTQTNK